jgi:Type ISP C-terminal specificity domain
LTFTANAKKKEHAPDGSKDENVFDIEQGVAISLFVKRPGIERGVWRGDFWGKRLEKYTLASTATLASTTFSPLQPSAPFHIFAVQDVTVRREYEAGWSIPDLFEINVLGFQTHRDEFAISFTEHEMRSKLSELTDPNVSDADLVTRYSLSRSWLLENRAQVQEMPLVPLESVMYRPFDNRWTAYSHPFNDRPRRELIDHVVGRKNIVIGVGRAGMAVPERPWELALVSELAVHANVFRRGGIALAPLYLFKGQEAREAFSGRFRDFLDARYEHHFTPEEILGYIYAVLYAPSYRVRYAEFLRNDFPRIPFPKSSANFETLSELGWALTQAHLMRGLVRRGLAAYHGKGDHTMETARYSSVEQTIAINKTQFFQPVPQAVWDFHIGGYQVLDKYLKSRKGRALSLDEINHVAAIADSLAFTTEQMAKIDKAYTAAFPNRG